MKTNSNCLEATFAKISSFVFKHLINGQKSFIYDHHFLIQFLIAGAKNAWCLNSIIKNNGDLKNHLRPPTVTLLKSCCLLESENHLWIYWEGWEASVVWLSLVNLSQMTWSLPTYHTVLKSEFLSKNFFSFL